MADVYTVNIDVIDMTIPIGNNRMIPVINQPNPALGYAATASEVSLLLKLANYIIYEAGTSKIIDPYNFTEYFPSSGGGGGGGDGDKSRYTVEKTTDGTTGEATYKLMQSINGARATAVGDVIGIRGNEMLVQYGNGVVILNTAIADIKEKMDATYNFTTFTELGITTSGKTLKEITDELHALNLPTNTIVTGQLYSSALPFSGNGEAEVMVNKPAYWWKCTSLNVAPYSWNAIAGGGSWSGVIMDWTPSYNTATTYETTGSGNAITDASYSNGKVTFTKGSTFLTDHPTITPGTDTTSTAAPAVGETFTAIDGITKDANGHVTAVNTKTVTMPTPTKSNVGLSEVTNDKQIKGLSTGTTAGNLVKFGNDGYTVEDSGVSIETGFTGNSDAKVPTSKSITTNVAGNAKLTGYSVDTARGNINADSTITDAVEQLEYREELNKTNILLLDGEMDSLMTSNLLNINDRNFVLGGYYNDQGAYVSAPTLCQSGYIPVIAGQRYTSDYHNGYVLWYDKTYTKVGKTETSQYMQDGYVTAPTGAYYVRFLNTVANIPQFQVVEGTTLTTYEPYGLRANNPYMGYTGVAFGTSLTYRAQTTGGYLQYLTPLSGAQYDNQGIGAATILQYGELGNILDRIKSYQSYTGKKICILEGFVNDWVQNHDKLGDYTDTTETTVCGCVRSAINYIMGQNANITIFLILDHYGKNSEGYGNCSSTVTNQSGKTQYEYYEEIAKVAESLGVHVIKEYAISGISENTPQYLVDNIHCTALGAFQSANAIWSSMRQCIPNVNQ